MRLTAKAQASMEKVIAKFQAGDISGIVIAARISLPEDAPAAKWSFPNRALVATMTGTADCRGYNQWKEVGRQVDRPGAGYIFIPRTKKNDEDESTFAGWITAAVHPINHTKPIEGCEDKAPDYTPKELPPLMDVAERLGVDVDFLPTGPKAAGWYSDNTKRIAVGSQDWRTFFHELGHAAHARVQGGLKGSQDQHQETTAELTACVIMDMYGHDRTGNAWDYIAQYSKDPLRAIQRATKEVGQCLDLIFEEAA